MSTKYIAVVIILVVAVVLGGLLRVPAQAETDALEVKSVSFSPDPPVVNEPLEFSAELLDETNVTVVTVNICTEISCLPPISMTRGTDGVYKAETIAITTVEKYHFNIGVEYDNGTTRFTEYIYFTPLPDAVELDSVEMVPAKIKKGETADIFATLAQEENITAVQLFHCQGDVCFPPVTMERQANGTYKASVGPFDKAEEVKYNVTITYEGGHKAFTADYKFQVEKKGGDGDDDDGGIPAIGAVAVIAILAGLAVTRRSKRA